jgi:hypothetical protein
VTCLLEPYYLKDCGEIISKKKEVDSRVLWWYSYPTNSELAHIGAGEGFCGSAFTRPLLKIIKMNILEKTAITKAHGKWGQPNIPHKGWVCVGIEDIESPDFTCQMCECSQIRYIHHMQHENAPDLFVGCICAGHMEENLLAAKTRENKARNRSARRKTWLSRKWKISDSGNEWLRSRGYRISIYPTLKGWGSTIAAENDSYIRHSKLIYETLDAIKLAAFNVLESLPEI